MKEIALVTGASRGIGRALARRFAASGFDLVLVARHEEDLGRVARECEAAFGSQVLCFAIDLSRSGAATELARRLAGAGITVDVLVNNAGFGVHGSFACTPLDAELGLVQIQIATLLGLTKHLVPGMVKKGKGRILNVASVYAYAPVPFQAVYAASKSFLLSFSEALANELRGTGVTVTVLCPGVTQTNFREAAGISSKRANSGMSADRVADQAFRGLMRRNRIVIPGTLNRFFVALVRHLPANLVASLLRYINTRRGVNR